MSADSVPPTESETTKTPADLSPALTEAPPMKRRFRKGATEEDSSGEKDDQTIELLSSLLQNLIAKKEQNPTITEPEAKSGKYHRLSKTGSGSPAPPADLLSPAPAPANVPASAPGSRASSSGEPVPAAASTTAPAPASFRPAPTYDAHDLLRQIRRWRFLCVLGIVVTAVATSFAVTRLPVMKSAQPIASKAPTVPVWSDAMIEELDQALTADQAGDLKGAQRIASAIAKPNAPMPPGLAMYLASVGTRLERNFDTEADLFRQITGQPPEIAARLNERLAFNFSRVREFDKTNDSLRLASQGDPFSPSLYYHWGETNRHLGHFPDAIACFRRALARVPTGQPENASLRDCIEFKLRLCFVEQGREAEFQPELAQHLAATVPSGYWLLTAAAIDLQHKDLTAAAGWLAKARDVLGAEGFDGLLNDYFFRAYADRKELTDYFPIDPAARRAKLMPSMAYTVEP